MEFSPNAERPLSSERGRPEPVLHGRRLWSERQGRVRPIRDQVRPPLPPVAPSGYPSHLLGKLHQPDGGGGGGGGGQGQRGLILAWPPPTAVCTRNVVRSSHTKDSRQD